MKGNMSIYMPQMDLDIIKNSLICFHCRDNMESYIKLKRSCRDTEEKINMYRQNKEIRSSEKIVLSDVFEQYSKDTLKNSDKFMQNYEVKKVSSLEGVAEFEFVNVYNPMEVVKPEFAIKEKEINYPLHQNDYNMSDGELITKNKSSLDKNTNSQSNLSRKSILPRFISRETMEEIMYECMACDFKTKQKNSVQSHLLTHKTKAEVTMYKCTACDYETVHKTNLKKHSLKHKPEAEVTMYKCTACDFKTKHKDVIKRHLLIHKTEAEVTMYKCTACDFETKRKYSLTRHSSIHKSKAVMMCT